MSKNYRVSIFPPWELLRSFLFVTVLLLLGTVFSGMTLLTKYFSAETEWIIGILFSVGTAFCLLNFKVSYGSHTCAKILKYYALFLALICMPVFILIDEAAYKIASAINIVLMLLAFYVIKSEKYQNLVQYQFDFFKDIKEARAAIEQEVLRNRNQNRK